MNILHSIAVICRRLTGRPGGEELDEEIQAHLQIEIDENIASGMDPEQARYAALKKFGNTLLHKEEVEAVWRFAWLDSLLRDIRYAFRGFRNAPGFALTVIGTLAIGLSALAASFSVFNTMVLQPFAVRDPYSLYAFMGWGPSKGWVFGGPASYSWSTFRDFRRDNPVFSEILGYQNGTAPIEKKSASLQAVTGNYFSMLGGRICMGRGLLESDDGSGTRVAVASYASWKSRFGADPQILGKTMRLRDKPMEIVGIACPEFNGPQKEPIDFWVSLSLSQELADITPEFREGPDKTLITAPAEFPKLMIIGRLKPGFAEKSAEEALLAYGRQAYRAWLPPWGTPPESTKIRQQATSFPLNRDTVRIFLPAFIAFGLVLLIACANVSNMMLARGLSRQREIGIRISLGAGRARMIRQLLTESLLLAIPAALVAFGLACGIIRGGYWLQTAILPASGVGRVFGLSKTLGAKIDLSSSLPDLSVLAFLFGVALIATLLFGLAPAIQTTRSRLVEANRGEFESGYRPARLRSALVIAQSTLCALLLIMAGVSMRNEMRIASQDLGLDLRGVFSISTSNRANRQTVLDHLSSLHTTDSIGTCDRPPLDTVTGLGGFPGKWTVENETVEFASTIVAVSPEYFDVFKIGVRGGKLPASRDHLALANTTDQESVIVSESFARRLWPSGNALGQTTVLEMPVGNTGRTLKWHFQVQGIAADSVYDLYDSTGAPKPNRALVYEVIPLTNWISPKKLGPLEAPFSRILVRMKENSGVARRLLQKMMEEATQGNTDFEILSAQDQLNRFLYPYRALAAIAVFLGALSFLLTGSGVFGMLFYVVTQRRREFGIRIALGAGKASVTGMVIRQSLRLATAGSVLGALAALGAARLASQYVYQINLFDAFGYVMGLLMVIIVALAASWIPARRAVNLDPARTLHCD
jgi:predicted permease